MDFEITSPLLKRSLGVTNLKDLDFSSVEELDIMLGGYNEDMIEENQNIEAELNEVLKHLSNLKTFRKSGYWGFMLNIDINAISSSKLTTIDLYACDLSTTNLATFCATKPNLENIKFSNCNLTDVDFIYGLDKNVKSIDLTGNPIEAKVVEGLIKYRRNNIPNLSFSNIDAVEKWLDDRGIELSEFIGKGINSGFDFEWEYSRMLSKKKMTVNDMHTLDEFIDFKREEFKDIERAIYLDENQELDDEYIQKIISLPLGEKCRVALTVEQARSLKEKLGRDIPVQIYAKTAAEISIKELNQLEEGLNIVAVQLTDDIKKHPVRHQYADDAYKVGVYKACRSRIDEIIGDIDLSAYEGNPNKEKIIFGIVMKRLSQMISYDKVAADEIDGKREITSRNMVGGLLQGTAVCAGYAEIVKQTLSCLGIEAEYVSGIGTDDLEDNVGHAWNQVKLDGKWYNLDLTNARDRICEGRIPDHFLQKDEDFFPYSEYKTIMNKKHECSEGLSLFETVECLYGENSKYFAATLLSMLPDDKREYICDYSFTSKNFVRNEEEVKRAFSEKSSQLRVNAEVTEKAVVTELTKDVSASEIDNSARILKETKKEVEEPSVDDKKAQDI